MTTHPPFGQPKPQEQKPNPAEQWVRHKTNPNLEVNGLGQWRTKITPPPISKAEARETTAEDWERAYAEAYGI